MKKIKLCIDYCLERIYFFLFLFNYIFVKNLFINFILVCVLTIIIIAKRDFLLGPFLSSVLTFNLVNGYVYYSKWVNWSKVKKTILHDINLFIIGYISQLNSINFPLYEENSNVHSDIDEIVRKIHVQNYNDYYEVFDKYEKYFIELIENDKKELQYSKSNMDNYKNYLKSNIEKINQNILITTVMFHENQYITYQLSALSSYVYYQIDYNLSGALKDCNKMFLGNVVELISQIKKIIGIMYKKV